MTTIVKSNTPSAPASAGRAQTYALLGEAFCFPDESFYQSVLNRCWQEQLEAALRKHPRRLHYSNRKWTVPPTYDEMQSEYIRLFQVGGGRGPPCPLHQGHYTRDRSRTLHDLIRFYNFFGFRVVECVMPDHLAVQLEFMSELAGGAGGDVDSGIRAQRDFLRLHLSWIPELARRVSVARPHPFYRSLTDLTCELIRAEAPFLLAPSGGSDGYS